MRRDDFAPLTRPASRIPDPQSLTLNSAPPEALIPVSSFGQPGDPSPFIKVVQVMPARQGETGRILEVWKERTHDDMAHHTAPRGHQGRPRKAGPVLGQR